MKKMKQAGLAVLLLGAVALSGCLTGCGTLDKTGVYNGDKTLYDADLTIATSYEVLHAFVQFEYDNRAMVANTPEVKRYADSIRLGAPQWFATAIALRDAYKTNPAEATRTALQQAIDVLREATIQSTKYLAQQGSKSPAALPSPPTAPAQFSAPASFNVPAAAR